MAAYDDPTILNDLGLQPLKEPQRQVSITARHQAPETRRRTARGTRHCVASGIACMQGATAEGCFFRGEDGLPALIHQPYFLQVAARFFNISQMPVGGLDPTSVIQLARLSRPLDAAQVSQSYYKRLTIPLSGPATSLVSREPPPPSYATRSSVPCRPVSRPAGRLPQTCCANRIRFLVHQQFS
jgi:hypothetical protein